MPDARAAPPGTAVKRPPVLWFDVDDLFRSVHRDARLSDAQRVAIRIYAALERDHGATGRIRFVRMNAARTALMAVAWPEVHATFATARRATEGGTVVTARVAAMPSAAPASRLRAGLQRRLGRLPGRIQRPLRLFVTLQVRALQALARSVPAWSETKVAARRRWLGLRARAARWSLADGGGFAAATQPGDVLCLLGTPSWHTRYGDLLGRLRRQRQLRFVWLVHDILPLVHPDWFDRVTAKACRDWHRDVLPQCDRLLVGSPPIWDALHQYTIRAGLPSPRDPELLPLGSSLSEAMREGEHDGAQALAMPVGDYVLCVAPIEARTNHGLLLRVWRRMTEERATEAVPQLVLVGRVGWLVADLVQQLRNADCLDGRIRLVTDAGEDDIARLYQGCLFTVCASLHEPTPLPVTESLTRGKPCIGSSAAAAPGTEALVRRFDPEDAAEAYAVICATLDDPDGLAAWQRRVAATFRPVPWHDTASAIMAAEAS